MKYEFLVDSYASERLKVLSSNYGPTADTGGLMQNHAPAIYAYAGLDELLRGEERGGANAPLLAAESWRPLLSAVTRRTVTLVYSAHDEEHNNAVALRDYCKRSSAAGASSRACRVARGEP